MHHVENIVPLLKCNCYLAMEWCVPLLCEQPLAWTGQKHHSSVVVYELLLSNSRLLWLHNSCFEQICRIILSRDRVLTIDGVWTDDRIYWTLWYSAWLVYSPLLHTVFTVMSSLLLLIMAYNGRRCPSSGFPNCPLPQLPASNSNSSPWLNCSSPLTNSVTTESELLYDWGLWPISFSWQQVPLTLTTSNFFLPCWTLAVIVLM
jgi:hypothetical protein